MCTICCDPHSLTRTQPQLLKKTTHDKESTYIYIYIYIHHHHHGSVALGWLNVGDRCSSLVVCGSGQLGLGELTCGDAWLTSEGDSDGLLEHVCLSRLRGVSSERRRRRIAVPLSEEEHE